MTNNYRICHVLTPSELFAVICHVCLSVYMQQISAKAFARFAH